MPNRYTKAKKLGLPKPIISEETKQKMSNVRKGKVLSDEIRKKISISMKKYLDENPDKTPYLLNHSSKESYPEKIFRERLERENIQFVQEYKILRYSLDFAFPDKKINVEIDGETHLQKNVQKIDAERNKILQNLGWKVLRFRTFDVKTNIENCVQILKTELENSDVVQIFDIEKYKNKIEFERNNKELVKIQKQNERIERRRLKSIENDAGWKEKFDNILNSTSFDKNIMLKLGWNANIARQLNISHTQVRRVFKKFYPELLKKSYNRK